jgi:hypothetical protein
VVVTSNVVDKAMVKKNLVALSVIMMAECPLKVGTSSSSSPVASVQRLRMVSSPCLA